MRQRYRSHGAISLACARHGLWALEPAEKCCVRAAMTDEALGSYFAERERSERALSRHALHWRAAAAHAEMADRYEALAAVFGAKRLTKIPIDYL